MSAKYEQWKKWYAKKAKADPAWHARRLAHKREYIRQYRIAKPKHDKTRRLKEYAVRVGTSLENVKRELKRLNGKCSCCGNQIRGRFYLDHDHKTNTFRGIVCCSCNIGLGHLDKPNWLKKAQRYLTRRRK